ncbi:MAG: transposase [Candidatus Eremiobacteraeota bacterium]|nr:transposase [Candidatus Eremiobacteraeota bacterium]
MGAFKRRPKRLASFNYRGEHTYYLTFGTWKRVPAFADPTVAATACRVILRYRNEGRYYLYAYVVMPDHIHVLLKLRKSAGELSTIVATIKATIKHDVMEFTKLNWQPGFHDWIKRDHEESADFVRYTLSNPVRAGLCKDPSEYPFLGMADSWR